MLYGIEEFTAVRKRAGLSRALLTLGIALVFAAGLVPMIISRNLVQSALLSIAAAAVTIFLYGVFFAPMLSYRRFMRLAEEGIRHTYTGAYVESGGEHLRDGVRFISMRFSVKDDEEPRQCYYDASLPPADLTEGRLYTVTHTGNLILEIRTADNSGGRDA